MKRRRRRGSHVRPLNDLNISLVVGCLWGLSVYGGSVRGRPVKWYAVRTKVYSRYGLSKYVGVIFAGLFSDMQVAQ